VDRNGHGLATSEVLGMAGMVGGVEGAAMEGVTVVVAEAEVHGVGGKEEVMVGVRTLMEVPEVCHRMCREISYEYFFSKIDTLFLLIKILYVK